MRELALLLHVMRGMFCLFWSFLFCAVHFKPFCLHSLHSWILCSPFQVFLSAQFAFLYSVQSISGLFVCTVWILEFCAVHFKLFCLHILHSWFLCSPFQAFLSAQFEFLNSVHTISGVFVCTVCAFPKQTVFRAGFGWHNFTSSHISFALCLQIRTPPKTTLLLVITSLLLMKTTFLHKKIKKNNPQKENTNKNIKYNKMYIKYYILLNYLIES